MKILEKAADYWNSHKNTPLFKGKVLAAVLLIAAIVVNFAVGSRETIPQWGQVKSSKWAIL